MESVFMIRRSERLERVLEQVYKLDDLFLKRSLALSELGGLECSYKIHMLLALLRMGEIDIYDVGNVSILKVKN